MRKILLLLLLSSAAVHADDLYYNSAYTRLEGITPLMQEHVNKSLAAFPVGWAHEPLRNNRFEIVNTYYIYNVYSYKWLNRVVDQWVYSIVTGEIDEEVTCVHFLSEDKEDDRYLFYGLIVKYSVLSGLWIKSVAIDKDGKSLWEY